MRVIKKASSSVVVATVKFYDKSAKEIGSVETHDRVPKMKQVARLFPTQFEEAVLVTCQPEPASKAPLKVLKNAIKENNISDTAATKFKKLGVDV